MPESGLGKSWDRVYSSGAKVQLNLVLVLGEANLTMIIKKLGFCELNMYTHMYVNKYENWLNKAFYSQ